MSNSLERNISVPSILKFAFPSITMMVIMSLYSIVDATFVSRLIGTDAFSAINIVYPPMSFIIGVGTMFGSGITAIVSRKLGEGKRQEANQNFTFIILFTIALGIGVTILFLLFLEDGIYLLGANEAIYQYCYDYALPLIFFFPANILQLEFSSLYVADGKPHIGLITTIISGITNIALDYIFIAKVGMGISGAAIATGIGYSIPALFGLFYFTVNRKSLCFVIPKADWRTLLKTVTNGSSEMVNYLSGSVTTFLFNIIMMQLLGQNGVAAISVLLYLDFLLVAISLGYSMGVAPLFSFNYGCENVKRLQKLYQVSTVLSLAVGIFMTVGTILFSDPLTSIFTAKGTAVSELAVSGLKIYAFSYLFKGYNIFASSMFTAFGNGKVSAVLSFMRTLVFLVVSILGLAALFGVTGVWYSTPVSELLAFILSVFLVLRYRKEYQYAK